MYSELETQTDLEKNCAGNHRQSNTRNKSLNLVLFHLLTHIRSILFKMLVIYEKQFLDKEGCGGKDRKVPSRCQIFLVSAVSNVMKKLKTCTHASMCQLCTMLDTKLGSSIENGGALILLPLLAAGCLTNQLLTLVKIKS